MDCATAAPACVDMLLELRSDLRRWAPRTLQHLPGDADNPDDGAEEMLLERYVRSLQASCSKMVSAWDRPGANKYSAEQLIRYLLAAQALRSQAPLPTFIQDKVVPLLPAALRTLALEATRSAALPARDTRLQLIVDTALMLWRREHCPLASCKYMFADSSPQGDRDWLICVCE